MLLEQYKVTEVLRFPTEGLTGRIKIKTPVREITKDNVREVLEKALALHAINAGQITYLYEYYKGNQDIRLKEKYVRENINNKVMVNRANEIVTFKSAYRLNEPIQYISTGGGDESVSRNVGRLNEFMRMEDKESKDKEIVDWSLICGVAERLTLTDELANVEDGAPFYTNSSHLPVGYTEDVFSALDIQDELQTLYTSGTVFHAFLGERMPSWKSAAALVRTIAENYKLPYYTLSPTYSVCPDHGYLAGEFETCPHCGRKTEVYSRITGYYRPVQNWNDGKTQEFKQRREYNIGTSKKKMPDAVSFTAEKAPGTAPSEAKELTVIATKTCPNCKILCEKLDKQGVEYKKLYAEDNRDLVKAYGIISAPAMLVAGNDGVVVLRNMSEILGYVNTL